MKKSITITIANQKGGVGKTTTAIHVGHGLAQRGLGVLLVDLDIQGNIAASLGLTASDDLYHLLHPDPGLHKPLSQIVVSSGRKNLAVIRSHKKTEPLIQTLTGVDGRHLVLADALEQADYDVIIFDCAPSAGLLQTAAMVASDYLIVPTELSQLSVIGIKAILASLQTVRRISRSECELAGIIPVKYNRTTSEAHDQLIHLATAFKKLVLPPIPQDAKCVEAVRARQTLWEYAPKCRALQGFTNGGGNLIGGYGQVIDRISRVL